MNKLKFRGKKKAVGAAKAKAEDLSDARSSHSSSTATTGGDCDDGASTIAVRGGYPYLALPVGAGDTFLRKMMTTGDERLMAAVVAAHTGRRVAPPLAASEDLGSEEEGGKERSGEWDCSKEVSTDGHEYVRPEKYEPVFEHDGLIPTELLTEVVALVEAVEVYERSEEECKQIYDQLYLGVLNKQAEAMGQICNQLQTGGLDAFREIHMRAADQAEEQRATRPKFASALRSAAQADIYQKFESVCLEECRAIHMQAANTSGADEVLDVQLAAVLRAANELVAEIGPVKNNIDPCFDPSWGINVLWSSCVAHVCTNQIIQRIGGPEGKNIPDFSATQLLDMMTWVESFRETIDEAFPYISMMHSDHTYFDTRPVLFARNKNELDMSSVIDSIRWANNTLWEVRNLAQNEFLLKTEVQTNEWLDKVYLNALSSKNQSKEGRLTTSLCEDVFSLAKIVIQTIQERVSERSDTLALTVCLVFSILRSKQMQTRDIFLRDFEGCCAATNDFMCMSEQCEEVVEELLNECEFPDESVSTLKASRDELVAMYASDAVYATQSVHTYMFEPISDAIADGLFGQAWEEELTHNELALTLTRTIDDFMGDLIKLIDVDAFMFTKLLSTLVSSTVVFYVKCLLTRAEKHLSKKRGHFRNNERALDRMAGDIQVMIEYFYGLIQSLPAQRKIIEKEFKILATIHELMSIAAKVSANDASDFILVLHKSIRDIELTKQCVGDLWHLMAPTKEKVVWDLVESMQGQLLAVTSQGEFPPGEPLGQNQVMGLRFDEMVANFYIGMKKRRYVESGKVKRKMSKKLKKRKGTKTHGQKR